MKNVLTVLRHSILRTPSTLVILFSGDRAGDAAGLNMFVSMKTSIFLSVATFFAFSFGRRPASEGARPVSVKDYFSNDLTISYSIALISKKDNTGIGETYNGGIETIFAGGRQARLRLVSLMRIESVFIFLDKGQLRNVTMIKESGTNKHSKVLTPGQWKLYNKKYDGSSCRLTADTAIILKHICKKAVITLKDGRQMTAWYTPSIQKPICSWLEPAFSSVPGLVLKYEYTYKKKTITYTATTISQNPIPADIFIVPAR
jgi:hypothetical protein